MKNKFILGIVLSALVLFSLTLVFSDTLVVSPTGVSYNEDLYIMYNFTINNTGTAIAGNFTQVNITFPSTFTIDATSNGTTAFGQLKIQGQTLSWLNATAGANLVLNRTHQYFWANVTSSTPGHYNISIVTINSAGVTNHTNVSLEINDTTAPYFTSIPANVTVAYGTGFQSSFNASDEYSFGNFSVNWTSIFQINSDGMIENKTGFIGAGTYTINVTINDSANNINSTIWKVIISRASTTITMQINNTAANYTTENSSTEELNIYLNASLSVAGNLTMLFNGTYINNGSSPIYNITNLTVGYYNVTVVYNGSQNYSDSWKVLFFSIDTTQPTIRLSTPIAGYSETEGTKVFTYNVSGYRNVDNCSLLINGAIDQTDTTITNEIDQTFSKSLSAASYNWSVNCTDTNNNIANSTTRSMTISAEAAAANPGGYSNNNNVVTVWYLDYVATDAQVAAGYSQNLIELSRVNVKVSNADHYVGLVGLSSTQATINVSSTPQQAVFNIGDSKKFEVTGDDYYDLLVNLVSISGNKANVTIKTINEKMPAGTVSPVAPANNTAQNQPASNQSSSEAKSTAVNSIWIWIVIAIVIIIAIVLILSFKKKRN